MGRGRRIILGVSAVLFSCQNRPHANIEVRDAFGKVVGSARLQELRTGVAVRLSVAGLAPGLHGVHVHERPFCSPPDFLSAGDHFDHSGMGHDHFDPGGHHAGDLPNLKVGADGKGTIDALIPSVNLSAPATHSLLREGGTSLVIHADADDMRSDPGGNAGVRIACGVIR